MTRIPSKLIADTFLMGWTAAIWVTKFFFFVNVFTTETPGGAGHLLLLLILLLLSIFFWAISKVYICTTSSAEIFGNCVSLISYRSPRKHPPTKFSVSSRLAFDCQLNPKGKKYLTQCDLAWEEVSRLAVHYRPRCKHWSIRSLSRLKDPNLLLFIIYFNLILS